MMEEDDSLRMWKTVSLGDVIELFDHRRVPLNSRQRQARPGLFPYYGAQGIIDSIDGYIFDGRYILVAEDGENLNSKKLPVALFAQGKFWVNNHAHILRGKSGVMDDLFLLACLNNADIRPYVTGAAQPKLSQSNLRQIEISLPSLALQNKIGGILSSYDELIENNQRRIRILEEMVRRLYREWFVHFRFSGHEDHPLIPSPLGEIPRGWKVCQIIQLTSFISRGISPAYDENGQSLVINQKCIRDGKLLLDPARKQNKTVPQEKVIRYGDVLINSTGVGTLGRVAQVYSQMDQVTADSHVTIVRPKEGVNVDFFGCSLLAQEPEFERLGVGATGQTELSRAAIGGTKFIVPPPSLQFEFGKLVSTMRQATHTYALKIQNLRRTRDLLLPRLLSGQIKLEAN